jgi:hypothetical protein
MKLQPLVKILWITISLSSLSMAAQRSSHSVDLIRGSVVSLSKSPIGGAKVVFNGSTGRFAKETSLDGTYAIRLPRGGFTLEISSKDFCLPEPECLD